jgi:aminopeptidase N
MRRASVLLVWTSACLSVLAQSGNQGGNPFLPPKASVHTAPDRTYDLIKVVVDLDVDPLSRTVRSRATETLAPIQDGATTLVFNAKAPIKIDAVSLDGQPVTPRRDGNRLLIDLASGTAARPVTVVFDYSQSNGQAAPFGAGEGGWHWIAPAQDDPARTGFWTQGETDGNSNWVPIWDYPNDFALTETRTTVPADWTVVGNGALVADSLSADRKTRTFDWRMDQPHATYLLSVVGGPFDVKKDDWEGTPLWYVVPRGMGKYIDDSFGDTKDMLTFFSTTLGLRYPWAKYAQNAMWEFSGGMENVSATTLGAESLTDRYEGFRTMSDLNSHELAHQWFGDFATCRDWGQVWLNESFAEYLMLAYTEHVRGKAAYEQQVAASTSDYLQEAKLYTRPLATELYPDPDSMFDSHAYPKGAVVLHTLRRQLGDDRFYAGLHQYLIRMRHSPADTSDLATAIADATGVNVKPFFDQWIYKPGHPVLDYTWAWDELKHEVVLHVKQLQDSSTGAPVYRIPTKVGLISGAAVARKPVELSEKEQDFRVAASGKPDAVLLDPDLDFLKEVPELHWREVEWPAIFQYAPNAADRNTALTKLVAGKLSAETIELVTSLLRRDRTPFPVFDDIRPLGAKRDPALRTFFLEELAHPNMRIRAQAVQALGLLPNDDATAAVVRGLVKAGEPYGVITNALRALAGWDAHAYGGVFANALAIESKGQVVQGAAFEGLAKTGTGPAAARLVESAHARDENLRVAALRAMRWMAAGEATSLAALKEAIASGRWPEVSVAADSAGVRGERSLVPDLKRALDTLTAAPEDARNVITRAITRLGGG